MQLAISLQMKVVVQESQASSYYDTYTDNAIGGYRASLYSKLLHHLTSMSGNTYMIFV